MNNIVRKVDPDADIIIYGSRYLGIALDDSDTDILIATSKPDEVRNAFKEEGASVFKNRIFITLNEQYDITLAYTASDEIGDILCSTRLMESITSNKSRRDAILILKRWARDNRLNNRLLGYLHPIILVEMVSRTRMAGSVTMAREILSRYGNMSFSEFSRIRWDILSRCKGRLFINRYTWNTISKIMRRGLSRAPDLDTIIKDYRYVYMTNDVIPFENGAKYLHRTIRRATDIRIYPDGDATYILLDSNIGMEEFKKEFITYGEDVEFLRIK